VAANFGRVLAAGRSATRSVFAGVGKTEAEIKLALEAGVFVSMSKANPSLPASNHVAGQLGRQAPSPSAQSRRGRQDACEINHRKSENKLAFR